MMSIGFVFAGKIVALSLLPGHPGGSGPITLTVMMSVVLSLAVWAASKRQRGTDCADAIRAVLDSAKDGFLVTDSAGNLVAHNGRLLEMWGISRDTGLSSANEKVIEYVLSQLKNPAAFVVQIRSTQAYPGARIEDVIEFKDGLPSHTPRQVKEAQPEPDGESTGHAGKAQG